MRAPDAAAPARASAGRTQPAPCAGIPAGGFEPPGLSAPDYKSESNVEINALFVGMPLVAVIVLFIGAAAFWTRGRYPTTDGATEIVVGVVAAVNALARSHTGRIQVEIDPSVVIQILGGIYVILRGLENVARGVKGSALEGPWNGVFPRN